ncbi:MAG: TonB-dependent receptor [Muribaculum sp.]|nr:TonB-dependent receptor [Muribaculum sp.]
MNYSRTLILSAILTTAGAVPAFSQELHENVNVEGTYRPDIVKAERFNTFPAHRAYDMETTPLDFDLRPSVTPFNSEIVGIGIAGWRISRTASTRGYLDLSLGSWLNSSLSAGYRVIDTPKSRLDISLQHNSTSLWKANADIYPNESPRFRYDESLAARYSHDFAGSILDLQLQYRLGYFNYYFYRPVQTADQESAGTKAPTQTVNDIAFRGAWHSPESAKGRWNAAAAVRHLSLRSLYLPGIDGLLAFRGDRETQLDLSGGYSLNWDNGSVIGIDAEADLYLYSHPDRNVFIAAPDNYGRVAFTPYYSFRKSGLNISIGADIDLSFNAPGANRDSRYGVFHIAPDVKVDWQAGPMGMYLQLLGGSTPSTLASQLDEDYYGMPALAACQPVYTPLDGRLGFEFGPFSGFSAGLRLAFRTSRHVPFAGWYPSLLNYGSSMLPSLSGEYPSLEPDYSLNTSGRNVHGWQFRLNAAYAASIWKAEAAAAYMPQNDKTGWVEGIDRPRWLISARVSVNPVSRLHIGVGYEYKGVRVLDLPAQVGLIYNRTSPRATIINGDRTSVIPVRLPDLTLLNADASWQFSDRLSIGVRADNLLNRRIHTLPNLPTPGIDIQGRLTFRF